MGYAGSGATEWRAKVPALLLRSKGGKRADLMGGYLDSKQSACEPHRP
jgi:hypothetical protein